MNDEDIKRTERDERIAFLLGQVTGGLIALSNSMETKDVILSKIDLLLDLLNVSISRLYYNQDDKND